MYSPTFFLATTDLVFLTAPLELLRQISQKAMTGKRKDNFLKESEFKTRDVSGATVVDNIYQATWLLPPQPHLWWTEDLKINLRLCVPWAACDPATTLTPFSSLKNFKTPSKPEMAAAPQAAVHNSNAAAIKLYILFEENSNAVYSIRINRRAWPPSRLTANSVHVNS